MKITKLKTAYVIFLVTGFNCLISLSFLSCSEKEIFSEYRSFPQTEWQQNDTVIFDVAVSDTVSQYDVFLELRNNNDYPYRNIWLFIDFQMPNGDIRSDTLNAEIADVYGKWYGKGISLYSYSFPYSFGIQYPDTGNYVYSIRQGMRDNPLKGISDIGLRVSKKSHQ